MPEFQPNVAFPTPEIHPIVLGISANVVEPAARFAIKSYGVLREGNPETSYVDTSRIASVEVGKNADGQLMLLPTGHFEMEKLRTFSEDPDRVFSGQGNHAPGITPIGRLLKKIMVDELPQLNNPNGSMMPTGLRPLCPGDLDRLNQLPDEYKEVYALTYNLIERKGVADPDSIERKKPENRSIVDWFGRVPRDTAFTANVFDHPDLLATVPAEAFYHLAAHRSSRIASYIASGILHAMRSNLKPQEAFEMNDALIRLTLEDSVAAFAAAHGVNGRHSVAV